MAKVRRWVAPRLEPELVIRVSEVSESVLGLYQSGWLTDPGPTESDRDLFGDPRTRASTQLARLIAQARQALPDGKILHHLLGLSAEGDLDMAGLLGRLRAEPAKAGAVPVALLDRWHSEVFAPKWPEIRPILERDVEAKRRLAGTVSVAEVVEEATNGGEYVPEVGIERVVLQPSYVTRPWMSLAPVGRDLVICYPVADDALAVTEEEARRGRILRLTKALGDETRLRALRHLAGTSSTLQELADELGVQKSTMHHHLAVMRAAGLLRAPLGEKRYSLRSLPLAQASPLLRAYLGSEDKK